MTLHSNHQSDRVDENGHRTGGMASDDGKLSWGFSCFIGRRSSMEDFFDILPTKIGTEVVYLFGIFDGHGGSRAAEYLKGHLFQNLMTHPKLLTDTSLAISETYKQTDKEFLEAEFSSGRDDGSTASTAILIGNRLYLANVGDSRSVISKAGQALQLLEDHKPNRIDERKRIENAGGVVMWAGTWRVGGILAMSRAFGDRLLKQFVVADPDIQAEVVEKGLDFMVLASDGLWDNVTNEEAVALVTSVGEPEAAARKLTDTAYSRGSIDNITCIVVKFHHDNTTASTTPASSSDVFSDRPSTTSPSTTEEGSSSASHSDVASPTPEAVLSSAGSVDPLLNPVAAGSNLPGWADVLVPTTEDYLSSADTADFSPCLNEKKSSSVAIVDSALDVTPPAP